MVSSVPGRESGPAPRVSSGHPRLRRGSSRPGGPEGRDDGPIGRCRPDAAGGRLGFRFAFELGAPPDAQCVLGSTQARLGPVAVLAMREDPTEGYWSTDSIWRATG